jgi:hypothetical protein
VNGFRGQQIEDGQKTKNHMAANRAMIKSKQDQVRQKLDSASQLKGI